VFSEDSASDQAAVASVAPMPGSDVDSPPQRDSHVHARRALNTRGPGPRPPVGPAPPDAPPVQPKAADTIATGAAQPPSAPWLKGLSHFGPALEEGTVPPNIFDEPDPDTPAWLSRLQDEWVNLKGFLYLWRPDWKTTFAPLYSATRKWQRLWEMVDPNKAGSSAAACSSRLGTTATACASHAPRHESKF